MRTERQPEQENGRLEKIVADRDLEIDGLSMRFGALFEPREVHAQ